MAIFESTAFTRLRKSFGNLTTYRLRGLNILRGKVKDVRNPRTLEQRMQRARMKESVRLSRGFSSALRLGFPARPVSETPFNAFVRMNMEAIAVTEELVVTPDFESILCASGSRKVPSATVSVMAESRTFSCTVVPETGDRPDAAADDGLYLVLYESAQNTCEVYPLGTRSMAEGVAEQDLPDNWEAANLHAYVFVLSASKRIASDSKYVTISHS